MGVKTHFQILRAGGFDLNHFEADEQPHRSMFVVFEAEFLKRQLWVTTKSAVTVSSTTTFIIQPQT